MSDQEDKVVDDRPVAIRWLKPRDQAYGCRLQYGRQVTTYQGSIAVSSEIEWIDVPTVVEP